MRQSSGQHPNRRNQIDQVVVIDRSCFWPVVLTLTTWVMAIGLAVFLFG
jgi:hypothetical protein